MSFQDKRVEKYIPSKWTKKQAEVSILISDNRDIKPLLRRDKDTLYLLLIKVLKCFNVLPSLSPTRGSRKEKLLGYGESGPV